MPTSGWSWQPFLTLYQKDFYERKCFWSSESGRQVLAEQSRDNLYEEAGWHLAQGHLGGVRATSENCLEQDNEDAERFH